MGFVEHFWNKLSQIITLYNRISEHRNFEKAEILNIEQDELQNKKTVSGSTPVSKEICGNLIQFRDSAWLIILGY